jgi:asparagine synthase (glutamine-hydrolysing)
MCGIAGIVRSNSSVHKEELKKMTDAILHRGPDGEGHWISPNSKVGFGHRRLSIIDLSEKGNQPMHYAGRYTITFNGEIYNYIELKEQLVKDGHLFVSDSDTEVLLALYDKKKEKCLTDLDGMFAFAIWDEKEQTLFCARDRFGEKPFHYFKNGNEFIFASEIKQIWALGIEKKISASRLNEFILTGKIEDEKDLTETFYENIKRLDAAHYFYMDANGKIVLNKYWDIDLNAGKFEGTIEQAAEQFLFLLTDSIRLRLRSDVAVGSSLSGGLDSSSIVMLIDRIKGAEQKQNTFSARFKNFEKDEGEHVEEVVKKCKNIEVHYAWPDENYFLKVFDKVSYHQDEPFGSASIIAQYSVMELAKKNKVTVLLDGQGADEYLAGYLPYYKLYLDQLFYNNKKKYSQEVQSYLSFHGTELKYTDLRESETLKMKLGRYKRLLLDQEMPYAKNELGKQLRKDSLIIGLKELLRYADRNSMAHSREVRLPFLSHKLVEFVFSLPNEYLLHLGWTKYVLRVSMDTILPPTICWRKDKIGYEPPQNHWLSSDAITDELKKASVNFNFNLKNETNSSQKFRLLTAHRYSTN